MDTEVADCTIQCAVTWPSSGEAWILARVQDANNFLMFGVSPTGDLRIYKRVAGVFTVLGTYALAGVPGTTYSLRVVMSGSTLTLYQDGNQRIVATESTLTTQTKCGLRNGGPSTGLRWDNFTVEA